MNNVGKGALALVAVVVIVAGVMASQGTNFGSTSAGQTTIGSLIETAPVTSTTGQGYNGDMITTFEGRDSNDPATTYSGIDDFDVICYERIGNDVRDWEVLGSGDDTQIKSPATIPIRKTTSTDAGITEMWCEIAVESGGASLIIDKDGIIKANSRIDTCIYEDPNLDQTPTWVCRVNLLDISANDDPNNTPTLNLRLKFIENAVSGNLDQTTLDIENAGIGNHENRIKTNIDLITTSTSNDSGAVAVAQIQFKINDTDDVLWSENDSHIMIPNGNSDQRIKLSQMDRIDLTSTTSYKWKFGSDIATANIINVPKSGDPEVDIPIILFTNFSSADQALCTQLELKYVDAFNAFSTTTVDVEVSEGATGDSCVFP